MIRSFTTFRKLTLNADDRSRAALASKASASLSWSSRTAISHYRATIEDAIADEEPRTLNKLAELIVNIFLYVTHVLIWHLDARRCCRPIYLECIVWSTPGWSGPSRGRMRIYNAAEKIRAIPQRQQMQKMVIISFNVNKLTRAISCKLIWRDSGYIHFIKIYRVSHR